MNEGIKWQWKQILQKLIRNEEQQNSWAQGADRQRLKDDANILCRWMMMQARKGTEEENQMGE